MASPTTIVRFVERELHRRADPEKAAPMAAYMKTDMPFYGVQKPARTEIARALAKQHPIESRAAYDSAVMALWQRPHRETKYLAIDLARRHDRFVTISSIPLYRRLIIQGAWWDFVDDVAINLVGAVLLRQRDKLEHRLDQWIDDRCMWIRRTAIICQVKHKHDTNERRLFGYCLRRADETEFFIRKAIGWALREHAHTAPDAVRAFVRRAGDRLSPLSVREASRHLQH